MVKKMDEEGGGTGGRPELGGGDDYDQNDFEQPSPKHHGNGYQFSNKPLKKKPM